MKVIASQTGTMVNVSLEGPLPTYFFSWNFPSFDQAKAFVDAINGKAEDIAKSAASDEATVAAIGVISKLADNIETARGQHLTDLRAMLAARMEIR